MWGNWCCSPRPEARRFVCRIRLGRVINPGGKIFSFPRNVPESFLRQKKREEKRRRAPRPPTGLPPHHSRGSPVFAPGCRRPGVGLLPRRSPLPLRDGPDPAICDERCISVGLSGPGGETNFTADNFFPFLLELPAPGPNFPVHAEGFLFFFPFPANGRPAALFAFSSRLPLPRRRSAFQSKTRFLKSQAPA